MATKTKRIQVKTACINCRKKHQGCDNHRPCTRCINSGNEETCRDIPHKRGKPKMSEKQPLSNGGVPGSGGPGVHSAANGSVGGPGGANSKKIYTLNDLMTTVEDIVVGKLEEENSPLTMMTINTEDLSQNTAGVRRSQSTRKYQSKWTHTHFQRPMKKSKSCESVPIPSQPGTTSNTSTTSTSAALIDPPIMTWNIPQFCYSSVESTTATPFLPPSLSYHPDEPAFEEEEEGGVVGGDHTHHHQHLPPFHLPLPNPSSSCNNNVPPPPPLLPGNIHLKLEHEEHYGMIPGSTDYDVGGGGLIDLMVHEDNGGGGLSSLGSPSSEGGSASDRDVENSGISGFDQGWVDTLDWYDLTMSEELFEN